MALSDNDREFLHAWLAGFAKILEEIRDRLPRGPMPLPDLPPLPNTDPIQPNFDPLQPNFDPLQPNTVWTSHVYMVRRGDRLECRCGKAFGTVDFPWERGCPGERSE